MRALGPLLEKVRRLPPIVADAAIGAWIFVIGLIELGLNWDGPHSLRPASLGLLIVAALGATFRRWKPWVAYAIVLLISISPLVVTGVSSFGPGLATLVVLYTVAEESSPLMSLLALLIALTASFVAGNLDDLLAGFRYFGWEIAQMTLTPWSVLAWFAGYAQARRRATASELERIIDELREERDRLARSAVMIERARIARELHTVVVRAVQGMTATTSAARRQLRGTNGQASTTIAEIEATGRQTLVEMRRLLHVLRKGIDPSKVSGDIGSPIGTPDGPRPYDGHLPRETAPTSEQRFPAGRAHGAGGRWASPWATDALIVLVMAIIAATLEPGVVSRIGYPITDMRTYVLTSVLVVGALLFRRIAPVPVLCLIAGVILYQTGFGRHGESFTEDRAIIVAVFTVAALRGRRWGIVALGLQIAAFWPQLRGGLAGNLPWELAWTSQMAFAVIAGIAVRERTRLNGELREQTEVLRRTREERVRLAVVEERTRIARDVHDLVAHGVTLMVIQAGAARWLAGTDLMRADQALGAVARAGQVALHELQSLVGSSDGEYMASEQLPTGEQLTIRSLVDQGIDSGLNVDLVIDGEPRPLDGGLELSLYRIVHEALTNVRKHASGARAWVELRFTSDGVEVEVTDTGGTPNRHRETLRGAGQGLVGIAERAALFGGRAESGPTPEGGFRIRASLRHEGVLV